MTATYLDAAAPIEERIDDLLARMTLEEKAGQLFHTMVLVGPGGTLTGPVDALGLPSPQDMVHDRHITHFNMVGSASAQDMARWHNRLQDLTETTRLRIPIVLATDPRHAFTRNVGTGEATTAFSTWPEPIGLAAIGEPELVEQFADACRREYLAVGLRVALHPQLDLATEPRWARIAGTFGEDADLAGRLGTAYIRGFRGNALGADSVATMIKHFPGGGPLRDGEDSHFPTGKAQVYPGGWFDRHLAPFRAALDAGATQVMPSYGIPLGVGVEEVACGFNRDLIAGLLRTVLGFDGIVCTDWGLITDVVLLGQVMPARAWGVEHLSRELRVLLALEAGVDQFGGEHCPEIVVDLVRSGALSEARVDESVRRVLRDTFALGLFERRHVDVDHAIRTAGHATLRAAGRAAQSRSVTVLANTGPAGAPTLPLAHGCRLYAAGLDPAVARRYATVVDDAAAADFAVMRLRAPFEPRPGRFESMFHQGSLEFPDDTVGAVHALTATVPTVLAVFLDRPAVLTGLVDDAAAVVVDYGCSDEALLDVLFGVVQPAGRLPFDLPRSMAAVEASRTDVAFDTADPLFRFGHGLEIGERTT